MTDVVPEGCGKGNTDVYLYPSGDGLLLLLHHHVFEMPLCPYTHAEALDDPASLYPQWQRISSPLFSSLGVAVCRSSQMSIPATGAQHQGTWQQFAVNDTKGALEQRSQLLLDSEELQPRLVHGGEAVAVRMGHTTRTGATGVRFGLRSPEQGQMMMVIDSYSRRVHVIYSDPAPDAKNTAVRVT